MTRLLIDNIPKEADFGMIIMHLHKMLPNLKIYQIADEKAQITDNILLEE